MLTAFAEFWTHYPLKVGKLAAERMWQRRKPPLSEVLEALEWQKRSDQWRKGFIPHPTTYLSQGRWLDEPPHPGWLISGDGCCPICGHPEPRWHSAVECNTRFLAQQREA